MERYALGKSNTRSEDQRLLTGLGKYADDLHLEKMTHAAMVRTPHAHAIIRSIDADNAESAPGVIAVLTGEDYRADGLGQLPCQDEGLQRDGTPMRIPPHPALPVDRVRFVGEAVAMVIAETPDAARDAAERVIVDYRPLPAVVGIGQAIAADAPSVWDDCPNNECFVARSGETAAEPVFDTASHLIHQSLVNHRVTANSMETRGYIGEFDADTGRYTLRGGVQNPHGLRDQLAQEIFRLPKDRIRIVSGDVGGSFGMRGATYPELALVLWAARRTGRPVKWIADRSEGLVSDDHGRDIMSDASLALDADGIFLGLRVSILSDLGAYLAVKGLRSALNTLTLLSGVYKIPVIDIRVAGQFTNTNSTTPYRGAGGPEAACILEGLIDKAAHSIGLDRVELRRRNLIGVDMMPYDTGLGLTYDCGNFEQTMDAAMVLGDVAGIEDRRETAHRAGQLRGVGICNAIEQTARPSTEGAKIHLLPDGCAKVHVGTASQGQGHETVYKQIVCDALAMDPNQIAVINGDTEGLSVGGGTYNSRSVVAGGSALRLAVDKVIETGREIAATLLEASIADIVFDHGRFTIAGTDRSVGLDAVAAAAPGASLAEDAAYSTPSPTFPNGTHVCEIDIDPDTGQVTIARYAAVDDVGTELNPLLLEGQLHGGIAQGIGQALFEAVRFDPESGQNLTGSFMDYAMPRADDLCAIETASNPVPTALNPLGVKGAGEAGTVGALPAVMCAIADALRSVGAEEIDMPATPERVWRALQAAGFADGVGKVRQQVE